MVAVALAAENHVQVVARVIVLAIAMMDAGPHVLLRAYTSSAKHERRERFSFPPTYLDIVFYEDQNHYVHSNKELPISLQVLLFGGQE